MWSGTILWSGKPLNKDSALYTYMLQKTNLLNGSIYLQCSFGLEIQGELNKDNLLQGVDELLKAFHELDKFRDNVQASASFRHAQRAH